MEIYAIWCQTKNDSWPLVWDETGYGPIESGFCWSPIAGLCRKLLETIPVKTKTMRIHLEFGRWIEIELAFRMMTMKWDLQTVQSTDRSFGKWKIPRSCPAEHSPKRKYSSAATTVPLHGCANTHTHKHSQFTSHQNAHSWNIDEILL